MAVRLSSSMRAGMDKDKDMGMSMSMGDAYERQVAGEHGLSFSRRTRRNNLTTSSLTTRASP
jgi:hypothetical protein